jgi:O-antigen ligase
MLLAILAVAIIAPFERVVFSVNGLTVTTVEAAVVIAIVAVAAAVGPRRLVTRQTPLVVPGLCFLASLAVAALAAGVEPSNALRFVARMIVAALLFVAARHAIATRERARAFVRVWLGVATLIAIIAVLEAAQVPAVLAALTAFRPGFHVVAGQLRATSTLFYPTIASMYLEVAFALGLWLLLDPAGRRPAIERRLVFAALVVIGAGISATFTRAGLLAMAAAIMLMAALTLTRPALARARFTTLGALATTLLAVVFVAHSPEVLAARLSTEGSDAWYGARYTVPATLSLRTGSVQRVPVTIVNSGRLAWDSNADPPFAVSYHWLRGDSEEVVEFEGQRTPFPFVVRPQERVAMDVDVIAPGEPGAYTLVWDVVHEGRAWLSTEGVASPRTPVVISGARTEAVVTKMASLPPASIRPARPALWSAALRMASEHPLLGIGPDNYRLAYGPYLQIRNWDRRVHANNMYLEILTGGGAITLLAFVWLLLAMAARLWRGLGAASDSHHAAISAGLALWLVVAGHGVVDSFLGFTTIYVTFALAAAAVSSAAFVQPRGADANRV